MRRLHPLLLIPPLLACHGPRVVEANQPPNVLLVVLDTTRADVVEELIASSQAPALARLAREGMRFSQARSTSGWTLPAHASLFTGLPPSDHGAHHEHPRLDDDLLTLAESLRSSHRTAGFSENPHIGAAKGFTQGFEHFEETWRAPKVADRPPPTVPRARAWLAEAGDEPFFLFVNLMAPHLPYAPPSAWTPPLPDDADEALADLPRFGEWDARMVIAGRAELSPERIDRLRELYRAEVRFVDSELGRLLAEIESSGKLDETLVIVLADHGENLLEHGLMEHQFSLHETLLRVPLLLRYPGVFDGGRVRDDPVQLTDVHPTVLVAVGRPPEAGKGLPLQGEIPRNRPQRAEYYRPAHQRRRFEEIAPGFDYSPLGRRRRAVVSGGWKLIATEGSAPELFHLAEDPSESEDLGRQHPEITSRLEKLLPPERARGDSAESAPASDDLDEETRDALRALGYAG